MTLRWEIEQDEEGIPNGFAHIEGKDCAYALVAMACEGEKYNAWYVPGDGKAHSQECRSLFDGIDWCDEQHAIGARP